MSYFIVRFSHTTVKSLGILVQEQRHVMEFAGFATSSQHV